jgi:putative acetyltransferase
LRDRSFQLDANTTLVLTLIKDDLSGDEVRGLLSSHLQDLADHSPSESVHALDIDGLQASDVSFWSAWDGDVVVGCGALKELDHETGEIKSMRTASHYLGKGVGRVVLQHLVKVGTERGYERLLLETGSSATFGPARALYSKAGFTYCGPFGNYSDDPFNRFMVLAL